MSSGIKGARLFPVTLREANAYVALHHRHADPVRGHKFSIGLKRDDDLIAVVIVGRPVARGLDDGTTAEVLRLCTDGTRNACSVLYGAARRAARAMGYTRVVTYTRVDEPGTSLRAAGFQEAGRVKGRDWACPARQRSRQHGLLESTRDPWWDDPVDKIRWES